MRSVKNTILYIKLNFPHVMNMAWIEEYSAKIINFSNQS